MATISPKPLWVSSIARLAPKASLNQIGADLTRQRARELRQAGAALGVSTVALLDYPDGRLAAVPPGELAAHVTRLAARYHPGGLLVTCARPGGRSGRNSSPAGHLDARQPRARGL